MRAGIIIIAILGIGMSSVTAMADKDGPTREKDKQAVLKIEQDQNRALMRGDTKAIDRLWPQEFNYISAKGELLSKADVIAELKSGKRKYYTVRHESIEVHDFGNTIVLRGTSTSKVLSQGSISIGPRTFVDIFAKQNGVWRSVAHTANPLVKQ
jgi:Domain of unknown function (DUF4440)